MSNGLEFQANYSWSHCLTDSIGYYGGYGQGGGNYYYWQNTYDAHSYYGTCYYDVPQAFNGFVTYDIPFGRGRMLGKNLNPVANALIGDWQVSGIVNFHSGFPFTIGANDKSGTGSLDRWPVAAARLSCWAKGIAPVAAINTGAKARSINLRPVSVTAE